MGDRLIGIDVGTSSIKVGLVDSEKGVVALESQAYETQHPCPAWSQFGADTLWESMLICLRAIASRHPLDTVKGIGFSCMSPGLVALDREGSVLVDPILYTDKRSEDEAKWILERLGAQRIFSITANNVMPGAISVTSMLWIKRNWPEIYEKTHVFGHINTFMCHRMTGVFAIDRSNASYTGLFDTVGTRDWSNMLCSEIGIDRDKLPMVLDSPQVCGGLCAEDVIACGVPKGTPVIIGGADSPCASFACGVISPGDICQSVGTSNVLTICTDQRVFSRAYLNRCHVVPGMWIYQGATSNAGAVVSWARDALCHDLALKAQQEKQSVFRLMDEQALLSCAGANGVVFLPYISGERCPVWNARAKGVFFGIGHDSRRHDLLRAVLESTCYATKQLLEIAEETLGRTFDDIDTVGGGAKSRVWTQMKADILNRGMRTLDLTDAAMLGAALLAGIGAGVYRDEKEAVSAHKKGGQIIKPSASDMEKLVYAERFKTYTALYDRVKDLF